MIVLVYIHIISKKDDSDFLSNGMNKEYWESSINTGICKDRYRLVETGIGTGCHRTITADRYKRASIDRYALKKR